MRQNECDAWLINPVACAIQCDMKNINVTFSCTVACYWWSLTSHATSVDKLVASLRCFLQTLIPNLLALMLKPLHQTAKFKYNFSGVLQEVVFVWEIHRVMFAILHIWLHMNGSGSFAQMFALKCQDY